MTDPKDAMNLENFAPITMWYNHEYYYKIALANARYAKDDEIRFEKEKEKQGPDHPLVDVVMLRRKFPRHYESCIISILFSAMTAEAFINYYASQKMSQSRFAHYDKLDLFLKWELFPVLINQKPFSRGNQELQGLQKLIELRNKLVHYKTRPLDIRKQMEPVLKGKKQFETGEELLEGMRHLYTGIQEADPVPLTGDDAVEGVITVSLLVLELKSIDSTVDTNWILEPEQVRARTRSVQN